MNPSVRRVASRYLSASPVRIDPKALNAANAATVRAGMDGNSLFRGVPVAVKRATEILASHGLGLSGLNLANLRGPEGEATVRVVAYDAEGKANLTGSKMTFQWITAEGGAVKVVAYMI